VLLVLHFAPNNRAGATERPAEPSALSPGASSPTGVTHGVTAVVAPAEAEPSTAQFEFHSSEGKPEGPLYLFGYVTNTSSHVIDKPKITVVLLDAQGKELGTDIGYSEKDTLSPGERSAVKLLLLKPPPYAKLQYEVFAKRATYIPERLTHFELVSHEEKPGSLGNGSWEASGKVRNTGTQPAKFVRIGLLALRGSKLVGVDFSYTDGEVLAPGATARYRAYMSLGATPERFELSVEGRPAN
jgi:hypothetical protein